MKLLFCLLLFTTVLCENKDDHGNKKCKRFEIENFNRIITTINVKKNPASFIDVVDVNHTRWLQSGYPKSSADEVKAFGVEADQHVVNRFGLDFSPNAHGVVYNPAFGAYVLMNPQNTSQVLATRIPYKFEFPSYRIATDSEHVKRSNNWHHLVSYGLIYQISLNGKFTGGASVGGTYYPGDIIAYNNFYVVKGDDTVPVHDKEVVEHIKTLSNYPTRAVPNSQGFTIQAIGETIVDAKGNIGCVSILAETFAGLSLNEPAKYTVSTNVMRWPCTGLDPL